MKQTLLILMAVALVGCHAGNKGAEEAKLAAKAKAIAEARAAAEANATVTPKPEAVSVVTVTIADPIVEKAIREQLEKPEGELTKADLEKVTELNLRTKDLTELPKGLEKLTHLTHLYLEDNPGLTFAQIDELKKALPKCRIHW